MRDAKYKHSSGFMGFTPQTPRFQGSGMLPSSQSACGLPRGASFPLSYPPSLRTHYIPVGLSLVLNDHVFLMDRLQQGRGQRLQVGNGLRSSWEAAPVIFREQILD